jgi:hypothetical protein
MPIVQMQRGFLGTRYAALLAWHIDRWLTETDGKGTQRGS